MPQHNIYYERLDNPDAGNILSDDGLIHRRYIGPSMNPTLKEPGLLTVVPYHTYLPVVGDIISFFSPEKDFYIVHRIIRVTSEGVITKGDNNSTVDNCIVPLDNIEGKVVSFLSKSRQRKVYGGTRGLIIHKYCIIKKKIRILIAKILKQILPLYQIWIYCLDKTSLLVNPEIIIYSYNKQKRCRLLYKKLFIGEYQLNTRRWETYLPYTLFVDKRQLPKILTRKSQQGVSDKEKISNELDQD